MRREGTPTAGEKQFGLYGRRAQVWRIAAAVLGLLDFIDGRNVIFSDGISYLEIARNYAAGNWHLAVNAYWSPLYSWMLAVWRLVLSRALALIPASTAAGRERVAALDNHLELLGLHALNLAAYAAAWIAFERLLASVDRVTGWKSEEARSTFVFASCYAFLCCALYGVGDYPSPDMIVLALFLWAACIVLDVRWKPFRARRLQFLGVIVAVAYLAKTAMLPSGLLLIAGSVLISRKRRLQAAVAAFVPLAAIVTPWMLIISAHEGHWTIGESGKLNYAWEVAGAPRSVHWRGEPKGTGVPLHATTKVFSQPDIYAFGGPIHATYAPWYDPSYWYKGIAPPIKLYALFTNFLLDGRCALCLLLLTPGLLAAMFGAAIGRQLRSAARLLFDWRFLLLPATATVGIYCVVFLETRYVAGPMVVVEMLLLAILLSGIQDKWASDLVRIQAVAFGFFLLAPTVLLPLRLVLSDLAPASAPVRSSNQIDIATELRKAGIAAGDRIAYVGVGINAYWALCDGVQIVAEIPVKSDRPKDDYLRRLELGPEQVDLFWLGDPLRQAQAIDVMRAEGARAIVADFIPESADLTGWQVLRAKLLNKENRERIAVRFLDRQDGAGQDR